VTAQLSGRLCNGLRNSRKLRLSSTTHTSELMSTRTRGLWTKTAGLIQTTTPQESRTGKYTLRELSISCSPLYTPQAGCDPPLIGVPTISLLSQSGCEDRSSSSGKLELILSRWDAGMPSLEHIFRQRCDVDAVQYYMQIAEDNTEVVSILHKAKTTYNNQY
jgi:hypothetical protein